MARIPRKQTDSRPNIVSSRTFGGGGGGGGVRAEAHPRLFRSHTPLSLSLLRPPRDCIDHRWRGCTRRKRPARPAVTSAARVTFALGSHLHPGGPRRVFPHAAATVRNYPPPCPPRSGICETVCCHRELERSFPPPLFHFPEVKR